MSLRQLFGRLPFRLRHAIRFAVFCAYQLPVQIRAHWQYARLYEETRS